MSTGIHHYPTVIRLDFAALYRHIRQCPEYPCGVREATLAFFIINGYVTTISKPDKIYFNGVKPTHQVTGKGLRFFRGEFKHVIPTGLCFRKKYLP